MRILLDECVPGRFRRFMMGHDVKTVPEVGWSGIKNGELLKKAAGDFEVLITVDRNLAFQTNPKVLPVPVVIIHARSNKLVDLEPYVQDLLEVLRVPLNKNIYHVGR